MLIMKTKYYHHLEQYFNNFCTREGYLTGQNPVILRAYVFVYHKHFALFHVRRHSLCLCLCIPQTLCAVSHQVSFSMLMSLRITNTLRVKFRETQKCVGCLSISAKPWEPLSLKILLDEITLVTYDRPSSKKYFAKLFIGLCS